MPKKSKWNEQPCPECKEPVAFDATRCPHCQAVYRPEQIAARQTQHKSTQKWGCGCVGLIGLFLLGMCSVGVKDDKANKADTTTSADAPKPGSASKTVTASVQKFYSDIMVAVKPCDETGKALSETATNLGKGRGSVYDAYGAASRVEVSCRASWSKVGDVEVPNGLTGIAEKKAEEAIKTCENAMIAKQMGGEAMKEVFDGNLKPSAVQDATDKASTAQAGTFACVAGIMATALAAGVDFEKLTK